MVQIARVHIRDGHGYRRREVLLLVPDRLLAFSTASAWISPFQFLEQLKNFRVGIDAAYSFPLGSWRGAYCDVPTTLPVPPLPNGLSFEPLIESVMSNVRSVCLLLLTSYGYLSVLAFNLFVLSAFAAGMAGVIGFRGNRLAGFIESRLLQHAVNTTAPTRIYPPSLPAGSAARRLSSAAAAAAASGAAKTAALLRAGSAALRALDWGMMLFGAGATDVFKILLHFNAAVVDRYKELRGSGEARRSAFKEAFLKAASDPFAHRYSRLISTAFAVMYPRGGALFSLATRLGAEAAGVKAVAYEELAPVVGRPAALLWALLMPRRAQTPEEAAALALKFGVRPKPAPYNLERLARAAGMEPVEVVDRVLGIGRERAKALVAMSGPYAFLDYVLAERAEGPEKVYFARRPGVLYAYYLIREEDAKADAVASLARSWTDVARAVPPHRIDQFLSRVAEEKPDEAVLKELLRPRPLVEYAGALYRGEAVEVGGKKAPLLDVLAAYGITHGLPELEAYASGDPVPLASVAGPRYSDVALRPDLAVLSRIEEYRVVGAAGISVSEAEALRARGADLSLSPEAVVRVAKAVYPEVPKAEPAPALTEDSKIFGGRSIKDIEADLTAMGASPEAAHVLARTVAAASLLRAEQLPEKIEVDSYLISWAVELRRS
ncbi:MAG: hypothetical protein ACP5I3_10865, partial [Thermoproteus sp.]